MNIVLILSLLNIYRSIENLDILYTLININYIRKSITNVTETGILYMFSWIRVGSEKMVIRSIQLDRMRSLLTITL